MIRRHSHSKQGYWRLVGRQFRKRKLSVGALGILLFLGAIALGAPMLANDTPLAMSYEGVTYWFPNVIQYEALDEADLDFRRWEPAEDEFVIRAPVRYSPNTSNLMIRLEPPDSDHYLGTDDRGRDVLSRLIWGSRISMSIGFVAVGIASVIGVVLGALAGYYRGWVDAVILRAIEIVMCFPTLIFILVLVAFLQPSIMYIMVAIGITGWPGVARLVRGQFLRLRESDFSLAARATGLSNARVMFRHILPNAIAPVLVSANFGVAGAILLESALSFLGFGAPPPTPSWGELLNQSYHYLHREAWWLVVFPGAAIFITVTAFNLVGDGLRDAMDPRLRQ